MLRFKVYYFNLTWEPKFKSLTLLEIQRAVEVEFMRIIKWLATGFEKKQPGVDIDLISSRCFNGLTVRWLYNLWFNLVFHFFHRLSHFASFHLTIKRCVLQCLSHVCRPGVSFYLRSVLIFGGRTRGGGDQMEWMCFGPGFQYVQLFNFTYFQYIQCNFTSSNISSEK